MSIVILQQGLSLLAGAWGDLTDAGVSAATRESIRSILQPLIDSRPSLHSIRHIRARRSGSLMYVDLVASVSPEMSVLDASELEGEISHTLRKERKEVSEVLVKFVPSSTS